MERKVCASQVALGRRCRNSLDRVSFHRALSRDRRDRALSREGEENERELLRAGSSDAAARACTPHVSEQLAALGKNDDRSTDADDAGRVDR